MVVMKCQGLDLSTSYNPCYINTRARVARCIDEGSFVVPDLVLVARVQSGWLLDFTQQRRAYTYYLRYGIVRVFSVGLY